MSAQTDRRKANEKGSFYSIKTGFKTIFTHQPLADQVEQAVQLLTPIVLEGHLLANLHILRHLESEHAATVSSLRIDQSFFYRCFAAVSLSTGPQAQQFNPASDPELAASYEVYQRSVPPDHTKPERPTFLKGVVNEAAKLAHINFKNHITTNFRPRTMRWFRLQLHQDPYFAGLPSSQLRSWIKLLYRASTQTAYSLWQLRPQYSSLSMPPDNVKEELNVLVFFVRSLIGTDATETSLEQQPEQFLNWLHMVLLDFQVAQDSPRAPKLFSMTPQSSNKINFIKISSTGLHQLLRALGGSDVPPMSHIGCKEFLANADHHWGQHTACMTFCQKVLTKKSNSRFHQELQTDGVSVSVLVFKPDVPALSKSRKGKRKRPEQDGTAGWVTGLPSRDIGQPDRIVGLDPGRKALFTAVVHSDSAAASLRNNRAERPMYQTLSCSSGRWRELSGIKFRLHKTHMWLSKQFELKSNLEATPTAKVATSAPFLHHIQHRLQHSTAAIGHFGDRRHRQLSWSTYIKHQQAYATICKEISHGSRSTVVAYGNAGFSSSCGGGNPSTPTVSLRRKLSQHCRVYDTDEFRTSMLCCACKTAMSGMPLPLLGETPPILFDAQALTSLVSAQLNLHSNV